MLPRDPGSSLHHVRSHRTASVAVCLTGQYRTFDHSCAGPLTVQRFIRPLSADVYAFMNAPTAEVNRSYDQARRILNGTRLRMLRVDAVDSCSKEGCAHLAPNCSGAGFPQTRGLQQCGLHAVRQNYTWIIRVRPDALVGFTMPSALPASLVFDPPRGLAIVGHVSECACGRFPRVDLGNCTRQTICGCAHDSFAMVYGHFAQQAYFIGFADDYDTCAHTRIGYGCPTGRCTPTPECRLGGSLAARGVPVYDARFLFSQRHKYSTPSRVTDSAVCPRFEAVMDASRQAAAATASVTVSPSAEALHGRSAPRIEQASPISYDHALTLNPLALQVLPPGPLDTRTASSCAQPSSLRPEGWELLCA